jgi:hypothetical protein
MSPKSQNTLRKVIREELTRILDESNFDYSDEEDEVDGGGYGETVYIKGVTADKNVISAVRNHLIKKNIDMEFSKNMTNLAVSIANGIREKAHDVWKDDKYNSKYKNERKLVLSGLGSLVEKLHLIQKMELDNIRNMEWERDE